MAESLAVYFNGSDRKRFIKALTNWERLGKRNAKKLRLKLRYEEPGDIYNLDHNDLKIIFKVASWAGSLKAPQKRRKKRNLKNDSTTQKTRT